MTVIQLENVVKQMDGSFTLGPVSFTTEPGMVTALIGPNGSGKSTLVKAIAAAGHEIACHGMSHRPLWRLEREEFRRESLSLPVKSRRQVAQWRAGARPWGGRISWR